MTDLLKDLSKEELFNVMKAYDSYINQKWDADRQPVCIEEFYTNEYAAERYSKMSFYNTLSVGRCIDILKDYNTIPKFGYPETDNATLKAIRNEYEWLDKPYDKPGYEKTTYPESLFIFEAGDFNPVQWIAICNVFQCDSRVCSRITMNIEEIKKFNIRLDNDDTNDGIYLITKENE